MTKTMEAATSAVVARVYKQLTPELYAEIRSRYLAGGSITKLATEFNVSLGAISGKLSRERDSREMRENTRESIEKMVTLRAGRVSAAVGKKLEDFYGATLDAALAATKKSRTMIVAAESPIALKLASDAFETPSRLVIDMFALANLKQEESSARPMVTVQVGAPSRRDEVIDVSPVLAS